MSNAIEQLKEQDIEGVRCSDATRGKHGDRPGQNQDGYGGKISTDWMILVGGKWYRVYVAVFSNAGTAYIKRGGHDLCLGSFEPSQWDKEWYQNYRESEGWPTSRSIVRDRKSMRRRAP